MGLSAKRRVRAERRARANALSATVVDPLEVRDPLLRAPRKRRVWVMATLGCVFASVLLHCAVVIAASLVPGERERKVERDSIRVEVISPPKPVPASKESEPPPVAPPPPVRVETPKPRELNREVTKDVPPPPDPTVDLQPVVADPTPDPTKRRRVAGLGLESTTIAGAGAAYAPGNTRMGETAGVAEDPSTFGGRVARSFMPPRRTSEPQPKYPSALRDRGLEGDVGVEIEIDPTGKVARVSVVQHSPHPEFDRAAADAAALGTYEPAKLDGIPVSHVITFTVRFRLHP